MPVLVTSNVDDDSIKNQRVSMETAFSLWDLFRRSRAANSVVSGPTWPKFELEILCMSSLPASIKSDKKQPRKGGDIVFPHHKSMGGGLSVAMETRVLIESAPKPYTAFPSPKLCYT